MSLMDHRQRAVLLTAQKQRELHVYNSSPFPEVTHNNGEGSPWMLCVQWVCITAKRCQAERTQIVYNGPQANLPSAK